MDQIVRRLSDADVAEVGRLEAQARRDLAEQRGGRLKLAERAAVGEWGVLVNDVDRPVWVSTIDGVVVGYLELAIEGNAARVMQVYVEPLAREVGFGDWMLEAAVAEANARHCSVIEGWALPGDRATKNLYERAGITARKITVSRDLP